MVPKAKIVSRSEKAILSLAPKAILFASVQKMGEGEDGKAILVRDGVEVRRGRACHIFMRRPVISRLSLRV